MKIPIVWLNLLHDKRRTAVGMLGVAFAALLMFMQLGFLQAVRNTATTILDVLDFDILLVAPTYLYLYDSGTFPRYRLDEAASHPDVRAVAPFYVAFNSWAREEPVAGGSRPETPPEASQRAIFVLGFDPARPPFRDDRLPDLGLVVQRPGGGPCAPAGARGVSEALRQPDAVLFDVLSHVDFGPIERLDPCRPLDDGTAGPGGPLRVFIGGRRARIVGDFRLATGFGADGAVLVGDQNFSRLFRGQSLDDVSLGLVRIRPGADPDAVARGLKATLGRVAVRILTRAEIVAEETDYWVWERPIGLIFVLGIVVACFVGVVFVYQILSSDITNRFAEFATLKAMGFPDRTITGMVLQQALILAHAGYVPGLIVAALLQALVRSLIHLPIALTGPDILLVYAATCLVCALSALAAVGKVRRADPADLFA